MSSTTCGVIIRQALFIAAFDYWSTARISDVSMSLETALIK